MPDMQSYRRPTDGAGWEAKDWKIDPSAPDASRANWALEYVRAPMAWGCATGIAATTVAVVDEEEVSAGLRYTVKTLGPNSWESTAAAVTASCVTVSIPIIPSGQSVSLGSSAELARETGEDCPVPGSVFTMPTFAPMKGAVAGLRLRP
jgi:hypothetical protein